MAAPLSCLHYPRAKNCMASRDLSAHLNAGRQTRNYAMSSRGTTGIGVRSYLFHAALQFVHTLNVHVRPDERHPNGLGPTQSVASQCVGGRSDAAKEVCSSAC